MAPQKPLSIQKVQRQSRIAGFTLIEVMVAISVFAVLAILSWRGLDTLVQGRTRISGEQEQSTQLQRVMAQMERDAEFLVTPRPKPGLLYATDTGIVLIRRTSDTNSVPDRTAPEREIVSGVYYQQVRYVLDETKTLWREPSIAISAAEFTAASNTAANSNDGQTNKASAFVLLGRQALMTDVEHFAVDSWTNNTWQILSTQSPNPLNSGAQSDVNSDLLNTPNLVPSSGGLRVTIRAHKQDYSKIFLSAL